MAVLALPIALDSPWLARCVVGCAVLAGAALVVGITPAPAPARPAVEVAVIKDPPVLAPIVDIVDVVDVVDAPGAPVRATWSRVAQTPGCWFFSGPAGLGRDHDLGTAARWSRDGDTLSAWFGSARFVGDVDVDGNVVLAHRGAGADGNSGWLYDERVSGKLVGGALVAAYTYRECELDGRGHCPVLSRGQCTISAGLTLGDPPRPPTRQRMKDLPDHLTRDLDVDEHRPCAEDD